LNFALAVGKSFHKRETKLSKTLLHLMHGDIVPTFLLLE
jgi:hypothetical protein